MRTRRARRVVPAVVAAGLVLAVLAGPAAAEEEPAGERFADLRVRSQPALTEIRLGIPTDVEVEDRSKLRPGNVVADEIRLFFPGATLERSRLVTVADQNVEEARLFPEGGGVVMTVIVRRPVTYTVDRKPRSLEVRIQPGVLMAEGATLPEVAAVTPEAEARRRRQDERRRRRQRRPGVESQVVTPTVSIPELREGEGLTVDAARLTYDREANQVVAEGGVTIARAGSLLTADEVRIDRDTKVGEAKGNVQLVDPQGTIRAERFQVDLDDETGVLENGELYLEANQLTVRGSRFEKSYGQTYHIENGQFTTCECGVGPPSWSIAGDEIDVTLDGYGIVENATFRIMDVPVFYLPIAAFPAKVTRQSGLLAPQFGFSQKRGLTFLQPLYVVLNKSADATVSVDVETEARLGGVAEYRYALDPLSRGTINGSFFDELFRTNAERDIVNQNVADPDIPDQRWSVTVDAKQALAWEINAFVDALAVSDDFFLREIPTFSFDPQYERTLRTSRYTKSSAGFYRLWDQGTVIGTATYYQDFIQEDDLTLHRLPQLNAFVSERFFDRRLKLRFRGEGVNFVRKEGFDGPRLDVLPEAEVPFRWQEYVRGKASVGFRETVYHLNETDLLVPETGTGGVIEEESDFSTNPTRELFLASAEIGTQLQRIFVVDGEDVEKLKHTIEPSVDYLFIPEVDQDDLPSYDFTDRVNQRNLFTYGVTSRLLAKLRHAPALPLDEEANPMAPGELNSFTGTAPSPFDDERTREGYDPFGGSQLPSSDPRAEPSATETDLEGLTPEEREARRLEEQEAVSRVVEWGRFTVAQSYDIDESLRRDRIDHFSDVDVRLRLSPVPYLGLMTGSTIDARESELTSANVGVVLRDPRPRRPGAFLQSGQPAALGISYRFITDDILEELDGGLLVPLADSLSAFYQTRYDAISKEFLENRWGFRLISQCQCWIIDLSVTDRINPNETELRTQVTLVGLGSIGRSR